MTTHADLIARLREGDFTGSEILEAADALEALEQRVAALVAERAKSAEQYVARLNQIDALTKERDELEISNAFANGEWRAVKDQLAALTKDKEQLAVHLAEVSSQSLLRIYAAQARESKLREALELWKLARDNAEESELDEYACYCIPMPLFCDAEEAMDEALTAIKQWKEQT